MDHASPGASVPGSTEVPSPARSESNQNYLRSALTQREFVCTAELVLGRDHTTSEAETFVKDAARNGVRVISLDRRRWLW